MKRLILSISVAACALCAASAQAAMYKWVDEKGVTQYTETPPPEGTSSKKIDVKPSPPVAPHKDDWKERELESKQRHIKDQQQQNQDARNAEVRRQRCLAAQRELDVYERGIPVYQVNERGERVYLDDAQRARERAVWKGRAQENCD